MAGLLMGGARRTAGRGLETVGGVARRITLGATVRGVRALAGALVRGVRSIDRLGLGVTVGAPLFGLALTSGGTGRVTSGVFGPGVVVLGVVVVVPGTRPRTEGAVAGGSCFPRRSRKAGEGLMSLNLLTSTGAL